MALDVLQAAETIQALENFLEKRRPPENIRHEVDLAYKIESQSVIIYGIRPHWQDKAKLLEEQIAKTTWVHSKKTWKVFWMRADLKWHAYEPQPQVNTIHEFLQIVQEDKYGCFWG